jgi:hypothetical protein
MLSMVEISKLSRELEVILGRRIQITMTSNDMLRELKTKNANLYYALMFGSIQLLGGELE